MPDQIDDSPSSTNGEVASLSSSKNKKVLATGISIAVMIGVFVLTRFLVKETVSNITTNNTPTHQELIELAVQGAKSKLTIPSELDAVTTLTGVVGTSDAIRYQYTLHDVDTSQISNASLKSNIAPTVCQNQDTRKLLDQSINMEYSYTVKGSSQSYLISVTKGDCI